LAAKHDRAAILDREAAAGRGERRAFEQDLARPRQRLDPCGGRDRLAGQAQVAAGPTARDHLARRDPDPHLHRLPAVSYLVQPGADGHRRERGADRVVVVAARPAEDGEYRVTDELLARAVEPGDGVGHRGQGRRDPGPDLLGVVLGHHPHVVDEIREERRDDAPVAGLGGRGPVRGPAGLRRRSGLEGCAAAIAEPRPYRADGPARRTAHGLAPMSRRSR
jgi:hypothetical protein